MCRFSLHLYNEKKTTIKKYHSCLVRMVTFALDGNKSIFALITQYSIHVPTLF